MAKKRKENWDCYALREKPMNETNEAFRDSFVIHWASPILFFDLNDFWGFPYQTMDFAISFIWECRHAPFTTSLKPMNGCKIR